MPCAIAAVPNSPIFTPSPRRLSPIFCKSSASTPPPCLSPSPLALKRSSPVRSGGVGEVAVCSPLSPSPSQLAVLKRKRPSKISIPVATVAIVEPSSDSDRLNEIEAEGEGYSVYCKRGKRGRVMEDRYSAIIDVHDGSKQALFGVFDGHGGPGAVEFTANNIGRNIMNEVTKRSEEGIEEAIKEGYLTTDAQILKEDIRGGTCCVTALVRNGNLFVSNAGDCRAVMSRGGNAEALTVDHNPSREDERQRIELLGGYVDCHRGIWRVHGSLAVSRAIGDSHLKQWVTAEPTTSVFQIKPECEFLILASDGLWDKVSNQEAVDAIRPLCIGINNPNMFSACKKLVNMSIERGSVDDISVMVIQLNHFIQQT